MHQPNFQVDVNLTWKMFKNLKRKLTGTTSNYEDIYFPRYPRNLMFFIMVYILKRLSCGHCVLPFYILMLNAHTILSNKEKRLKSHQD